MTNQTIDGVPRELLERILSYQWFPSGGVTTFDHRRLDRERLITMMEAERCTSCDGSGDLTDFTGEWRGYCVCPDGIALKNKAAAQPQGVPVAWMNVATGHVTTCAVVVMDWDDEKEQVQSLYAEQPAPVAPTPINYGALDPVERLAVCRGEVAQVAVVLPEYLDTRQMDGYQSPYDSGWNACLDELKRLNPSL